MVAVDAGEVCGVELAPADLAGNEALGADVINDACSSELGYGGGPVVSCSRLLVEVIGGVEDGD